MTANELKIAGLLLAAGGSARLGRPKQLVEFEGRTLIRRAAEALLDAGFDPAVVVVGFDAENFRSELDGLALDIVENAERETGMSSSIRTGMDSLLAIEPFLDAVLISLVDQPLVTGSDLRGFIEQFAATSAPIIAAEYDGVFGVPALFDASYFTELTDLAGDKGARELIRNEARLRSIALPEARVDIDTLADLARLHGD